VIHPADEEEVTKTVTIAIQQPQAYQRLEVLVTLSRVQTPQIGTSLRLRANRFNFGTT